MLMCSWSVSARGPGGATLSQAPQELCSLIPSLDSWRLVPGSTETENPGLAFPLGPNWLGCQSFGRLEDLGGHKVAPVLTLIANMLPANYSRGHLIATCNSTEVARFQNRLWPGKLLTALNCAPLVPK